MRHFKRFCVKLKPVGWTCECDKVSNIQLASFFRLASKETRDEFRRCDFLIALDSIFQVDEGDIILIRHCRKSGSVVTLSFVAETDKMKGEFHDIYL